MKLTVAVLLALASSAAFADSESYPTPAQTGVIGYTVRQGVTVVDTGSEQMPVLPGQLSNLTPANCVNGIDMNTGEALLVCRNGGN